jgi:hypothetical protein
VAPSTDGTDYRMLHQSLNFFTMRLKMFAAVPDGHDDHPIDLSASIRTLTDLGRRRNQPLVQRLAGCLARPLPVIWSAAFDP